MPRQSPWIPASAGMTSAPNGDTQHGKERIRVLPRLLFAKGRFRLELPDVGQRHVRQARRHPHRDSRLELLRRLDRLRRGRRTAAPGALGAQLRPGRDAHARQADGRHLRRLLAGPARSQGAHRPQRGPAQGNQRGAGRCRPAIPGHHADPPHGRGAGRGSRLRRAEAAGGEAARRHQVCRLRRLPDQPPLRHRRRILREPGVPRQAGGDRGRRGRALRPESHLARWRFPSRRKARSRFATSSSRPTTTAPK